MTIRSAPRNRHRHAPDHGTLGRRLVTMLATATAVLAGAGGLVVLTAPLAAAGVTSVTYTDASTAHAWTVPQGVSSITVDALGGSGNTVPGSNGGAGAHVVTTLAVTPSAALYVHVAGNGGIPGGGANGGGAGSAGFGGGGGASDVRDGSDDLASRVLVAGGGGGQGFFADGGAAGQAGGGDVDPPFIVPAQPGTQTSGGAGGVWLSGRGQNGSLGQGGDNSGGGSDTSSGGGGGYYGGGAGAVYGSGAGGSSYVAPGSTNTSVSLGALGAAPYVKITWTTPAARSISVTSLSLPADGTSTGTVTATVTDQYGQRVPGDTVTFTASDAGVGIGAVTDHGDGTYSATVTASNTRGAVSITAHDGSVTSTGTLTETGLTQTISFTSTAPATATVGGATYTVSATGGGSGEPVTFSVDSSTTNAACTLSGAVVTFAHAGSCVIAADQAGNGAYSAAATVTQTIPVTGKTAQAISITSQAPSAAVVTDTYAITATGGGSGEPVTFSSLSTATCTVSGSTVTFVAAGTCTVAADQAGNASYDAAPQATQAVTVARIGATVSIAAPGTLVYGQQVTISATVAPGKGSASGTVQFAVDGTDVGAPVALSSGSATSPALTTAGAPLAAGSHAVTASYVPTNTVSSAPQSGSGTVGVDKSATRSTLTVTGSTLTATISAVAPGSGTPTGTVTFAIDGAPIGTGTLSGGIATLQHAVPSGMQHHVSASYGGDANFMASSDSTVRDDPRITARISSPTAKSTSGWYRSPVTVSFTCTPGGAPLTAPCPSKVVLTRSGAAQSVSRTITATDGGVATVSVTGIKIDRIAPRVWIAGVKDSGRYVGRAPAGRCRATDSLSGVATCTVKTTRKTSHGTITLTVRVKATDKAGNTSTRSTRLTVVRFGLADVSYTDGAYNVRRGKTYTMVALSKSRPKLLYAAPYPHKPAGGHDPFHRAGSVRGLKRWVLGITLRPGLGSHKYWNLGIQTGHSVHKLKLRVAK